jgi:hypothetical protein
MTKSTYDKSMEEFDKLETFSAETKNKGEWTFTVDISEHRSR